MHDLGYFPHTAMKCPDLENPMNGRVNAKKQTLDSTAEYECNNGFILAGGDRVRRCLAGGSWSGKAPLCECKFMCIIIYFMACSCALLLFADKQHSKYSNQSDTTICKSREERMCSIH